MSSWEERFKADHYIYGTEANAFLKEMQPLLKSDGNALALAEGEGRNAVFLAQQGMKVTAWDYAASGLTKTERLAQEKGVEVKTEKVDLNDAVWEKGKWDAITCIFGHFPEKLRRQTLAGVKDAVKPGGFLVAEVYSPYQLSYGTGGPKDEQFLYKPEEFLQVFHDWRIVHFFMGEAERHEGDLHNGLSHVIQFAGQKNNSLMNR
ncbi:class I SAM-dependent methyltransferase [Metabacillus sp. 113a]|uniref:class I SAM-dependent methyltransferase n=1 Tax=Metabacillus sp. 113a TaxID=3404706 RepID=UPI003CF1F214